MSVLKSVFEQKQSVIKENCYSSVNIAKSTLGPKDEISFFNKIGALKGFRRKDEYVQKRPYCLGGEGGGLTALDMVHSEGIVMRHNISLGGSNLPPPIRLDHCAARNNYQSKVQLDIALEYYDEDSI